MKTFFHWLLCWIRFRPHFVIGVKDNPYMLRWWIFPRNKWFGVYLHKFLHDDDDRAMHDHPWYSISFVLWGSYIEHTPDGKKVYSPGSIILRSALHRHRVELINNRPVWTLFFTGWRVREWGFWCPQGFVLWRDFVAADNAGEIGKGCDQ